MFLTLVNALTKGTITKETAIAKTPISGDILAAVAKSEVRVITNVEIPTTKRPEITPAYAPAFVIFFEKRPQMYGPIKHPETTPQEKDIRLTIIGIFCVAKINEQATNTRQRSLVKSICVSGFVSFFLTVGIRSTATADADVKTTASRVDIDAERRRVIITAKRIIPNVPPPKTSIKTAGIIESIPPSGSTPPKISLEVEPIRYAPQPMTTQKIVEIIVPRLIAAVSFTA